MQKNLTEGSLVKNLIAFSLPYLLSCFLQTFYGLADLFIAGQFNGASTISAVSIGSQVMHMLTVIIAGLTMGTTITISQSVGARDKKRAASAIGNTAVIFLVFSIFATIGLTILIHTILNLLSTPPEAMDETRQYLLICFIGIPFITAYNVVSGIFRGLGDSKSPMYFVAVAGILNIILDYILIGLVDMGASGAAIATVVSQAVSVVIALFALSRVSMGINFNKKNFRMQQSVFGSILKIGIPIALQDGFIQISFLIITAIANGRGVTVAASVGIVEKIISFLFLVNSAMLSSVSAIAAQNIGAGKRMQARKILYYGIGISVSFGILATIICEIFTNPLICLFVRNDPDVVIMGAQYLRSYIVDCIFAAIHFCFSGYFCACGKSVYSFLHNTIAILLVRIPGAYLASIYFPNNLFPMGMAAPIGSLLSSLICIAMFVYMERKKSYFQYNL